MADFCARFISSFCPRFKSPPNQSKEKTTSYNNSEDGLTVIRAVQRKVSKEMREAELVSPFKMKPMKNSSVDYVKQTARFKTKSIGSVEPSQEESTSVTENKKLNEQFVSRKKKRKTKKKKGLKRSKTKNSPKKSSSQTTNVTI